MQCGRDTAGGSGETPVGAHCRIGKALVKSVRTPSREPGEEGWGAKAMQKVVIAALGALLLAGVAAAPLNA
ncbi:MAG: hypothetical protein KKB47_00500, partial [Alphaproteobacteria bacterium]|nr:hypothetical protein [Alphaproteobacteria bacterium]